MELIGIPHRLVVGERSLKDRYVEYQGRRDEKSEAVPLPSQNIVDFLKAKIGNG
jgi:prolyl-tRNA synthetase